MKFDMMNQSDVLCPAADKVILIIGISTYRSYGQPLPAIPNDLQETVKAFEKMAFKVISLLDLTLVEMNNAVDLFCDLISSDVYGRNLSKQDSLLLSQHSSIISINFLSLFYLLYYWMNLCLL